MTPEIRNSRAGSDSRCYKTARKKRFRDNEHTLKWLFIFFFLFIVIYKWRRHNFGLIAAVPRV
jgi:hypothetical protein